MNQAGELERKVQKGIIARMRRLVQRYFPAPKQTDYFRPDINRMINTIERRRAEANARKYHAHKQNETVPDQSYSGSN